VSNRAIKAAMIAVWRWLSAKVKPKERSKNLAASGGRYIHVDMWNQVIKDD